MKPNRVNVFFSSYKHNGFCLDDEKRHPFSDLFADSKEVEKHNIDQKELEDALSNLPANGELFEGDMVMDSRLRNAVLGISKKTALSSDSYKWPNGILYYEVESGFSKHFRFLTIHLLCV